MRWIDLHATHELTNPFVKVQLHLIHAYTQMLHLKVFSIFSQVLHLKVTCLRQRTSLVQKGYVYIRRPKYCTSRMWRLLPSRNKCRKTDIFNKILLLYSFNIRYIRFNDTYFWMEEVSVINPIKLVNPTHSHVGTKRSCLYAWSSCCYMQLHHGLYINIWQLG